MTIKGFDRCSLVSPGRFSRFRATPAAGRISFDSSGSAVPGISLPVKSSNSARLGLIVPETLPSRFNPGMGARTRFDRAARSNGSSWVTGSADISAEVWHVTHATQITVPPFTWINMGLSLTVQRRERIAKPSYLLQSYINITRNNASNPGGYSLRILRNGSIIRQLNVNNAQQNGNGTPSRRPGSVDFNPGSCVYSFGTVPWFWVDDQNGTPQNFTSNVYDIQFYADTNFILNFGGSLSTFLITEYT